MFISCTVTANAQNYLISFAGSGATTTINSIKVDNISTGLSVLLSENDLLRLTASTGIEFFDYRKLQSLVIYPNPSDYSSIIEIFSPSSGESTISVYDMSGKRLSQTRIYLDGTGYKFSIEGLATGFYIVEVRGRDYRLSGKLIGKGLPGQKISINKSGDSGRNLISKDSNSDTKGEQATVDMPYTSGDRLMFTALSGNYETVVTDIPSSDKTITFNFIACTDGGGNHYPIVQIGSAKGDSGSEEGKGVQTWMAENLKTTKFSDGTEIPLETDHTVWKNLNTPAYCWYKNEPSTYGNTYGALYNWYAVNTGKLCPEGWHVPSKDEWIALMNYLGGKSVAGGKLKESGTAHWYTPNTGATNETGFRALPGGARIISLGFYYEILYGMWWSSTRSSSNLIWAYFATLYYDKATLYIWDGSTVEEGHSVRCVKN